MHSIKSDAFNALDEIVAAATVRIERAGSLALALVATSLEDHQESLPTYIREKKKTQVSKIRVERCYICRIVCRVAQPGVCCSAAPIDGSLLVATWQRRRNSSLLKIPMLCTKANRWKFEIFAAPSG